LRKAGSKRGKRRRKAAKLICPRTTGISRGGKKKPFWREGEKGRVLCYRSRTPGGERKKIGRGGPI